MAVGTVTELYAYRAINMNSGVETYTRGLHVEGLSVDAARLIPGIPQAGHPHPNYSTHLLTSRTSQVYGRGTLFICNYVPAEYAQGSVPPVNQYAEGFIGKDVSYENDEITIPRWKRYGVESVDAGGSPISLIVYGEAREFPPIRRKVPYYSVPLSFELLINNTLGDVFNFSDVIVEQTNKLHTIFGRKLLFACQGVTQRGTTEFKATYRWYDDQGVPNTLANQFDETFASGNGNIGRIGTVLYPFFDSQYQIPPFKGLYISGALDPSDPPEVVFFDKFEEDANGWQSLPGVTL